MIIELVSSEKFYIPMFTISLGIIFFKTVCYIIDKMIKTRIPGLHKIDKKQLTIISLIKNILKFLTVAVVIIIILNVFGIDTTSILASLGIVGVVLGLACQDIAKDLLAGIFIIFDNQYAVGDYIEINGFMGEVVELGLKTTKIKAYSGEVKSISNSSFTEVLNYNLSNYRLILKINLDYDCDLAKVEQVLEGLRKEIENMKLVKKYTLLGIDNYEESYMRYSIEVECKAMQQYGIKRAVYKLIYNSFRENEIKIASNKIRVEK